MSETPRIRVDVVNAVLGNCTFWEGPSASVSEIRNIPAREAAERTAKDGEPRSVGMWRVYVVPSPSGD